MSSPDKFVRDTTNEGVVLNTDSAALQAYKLQKNKNKEIDNLKKEIFEIKQMMQLILNKL